MKPGQIVAVLGDNGAGKTTLLRCLATLYTPDEGDILLDGERLERERIDLRKRLAFVPDQVRFNPSLAAISYIELVLRLYDREPENLIETVTELLSNFDLLALINRPLRTLSRGQRYKIAIVAALAVDPELWIFDEPFASGMDPRGIRAFRQHCLEATRRRRTIFYTTQILDIAERFSDVVCILRRGRLHAFGTLNQLREIAGQGDDVLESIFASDIDGAAS